MICSRTDIWKSVISFLWSYYTELFIISAMDDVQCKHLQVFYLFFILLYLEMKSVQVVPIYNIVLTLFGTVLSRTFWVKVDYIFIVITVRIASVFIRCFYLR